MKQWERLAPAPPIGTLGVFLATAAGYVLFVNGVLFQPPASAYLAAWAEATDGWISPTLVATLPGTLLFLLLVRWTRAMPFDALGLRAQALLPGLAIALAFWLALELAGWLIDSASAGSAGMPAKFDVNMILPRLFGQIAGNCLLEELLFRGFLPAQFYLHFRRRWNRRASLFAALAVSQLLFAIWHLPNDILVKEASVAQILGRQLRLTAAGWLFAGVYLSTNNLIAAVFVHAINNVPLPLLSGSSTDRMLFIPGVLALIGAALASRAVLRRCRATAPTQVDTGSSLQ